MKTNRKSFYSCLLGVFSILIFAVPSMASTEPIAYYSFDNATNMGYDSSGNNLHGSDSGAQYISEGVVNGAAYFAGSGQRITIPDNALLNNTNFTVTFFIKTPDPGSPSGKNRIMGKYSTTEPGGWCTYITSYSGIILSAGAGSENTVRLMDVKNTGRTKWTHVAMIFSPSYCATYTNGILAASTNWNNDVYLDSTYPLEIGGYGSTHLLGWLDEVKVWDGLLDESIIINEANKLKKSSNLIAYYSFDNVEDMGYDSSGNELHGSDSGAQYLSNGVVNGAAYFGGSGQRITIPDNALLNNTNFTVCFFLKTPDSGSPSGQNRIMGKYSTTEPGGWCTYITTDNGVILSAGNEKLMDVKNTGRTEWTHIAMVFSPSYCATYTNGILAVSTNWNDDVNLISSYDFEIGGYGSTHLLGWLDEVKIWDGVLDENIIKSEADKLNYSTNLVAYYSFDNAADMGHDSSGNNLQGDDSGIQYLTEGVVNGAAYFDGSSRRITVAHTDTLNLSEFTLSFFLKTPTSTSPSGQNRIMGKYSTDNPAGWCTYVTSDNGVILSAGAGAVNTVKLMDVKKTGRTDWTHIVMVFSPSYCATYTNGILAVSTNWNNEVFLASDVNLEMGGYGAANFWGWLDEVKIWKGLLDDAAILAEAGRTTQDAVPHIWPGSLDFSSNSVSQFINLDNNGTDPYSFSAIVSSGSEWLSVNPSLGTVSNNTVLLSATADRSSLENGTYEGTVAITPSVGAQVVITATVTVTDNTVIANANGPYTAQQGSPVTLNASGSQGVNLLYRWEVGQDFVSSYSSDNFDFEYIDTYVPGIYNVILSVSDTNVPPNTADDTTILTIENAAPAVELEERYLGTVTNSTVFIALGSDPGIYDELQYRWDFDGDELWDTDWSSNHIASFTYATKGIYLVTCEVKDDYDAVGSDTATVQIDIDNMPPVADAFIDGTTLDTTNMPGFGYTISLDGSGSFDPDNTSDSIYFDWREDVNNPQKPVISEDEKHLSGITTLPLNQPGQYTFHLVVFDGELLSETATITVNVPGWKGEVICEGFAAKVPLWGVEVTVTNTFTSLPNSGRTDFGGTFLVDSGPGYQVALLQRRAGRKTVPILIDADGESSENIYFTPNYYSFAGQVVTGAPGNYIGIPEVNIETILGNIAYTHANAAGSFGYGMLPETWPLDGELYKVRIQKTGCRSKIVDLRLNMDKNSELIALERSEGTVSVYGKIISALSEVPVEDVLVDFGNDWSALSDSNGQFGPVSIPEGDYIAGLYKDGFTDTYQASVAFSPGTTNLTFTINGGEVSVFGQIYDTDGNVVTNAVVRIMDPFAHSAPPPSEYMASGAGYYDITVAKGYRKYVVSSPNHGNSEVVVDINDHTKKDIILPIPEPVSFLWLVLGLAVLVKRG